MSYSNNNKLRVYAENAKIPGSDVEDSDGIIYPASTWESKSERKLGAVTGIADSQEFNTALRQATIGSTILAEIIGQRYGLEVSSDLPSTYSDFENYITALASKFTKTSFLHDNEVLTKHIADANITTDKIKDANVTTAKIADGNVTTAKIADGNVTKSKLNNDVLTGMFSSMSAGYLRDIGDGSTYIKLNVKRDSGITNTMTFYY